MLGLTRPEQNLCSTSATANPAPAGTRSPKQAQ